MGQESTLWKPGEDAGAADIPSLAEGDVVAGRYRVERKIAQGGMGVVVQARHIKLGQQVAIKVLRHQNSRDEQSIGRFLTEAKASARLKGQHVVRVSDVGTLDGGAPFMVMELLEGLDLAAVVDAEGPLPVEVAVDYVLQACEGLAEAHAARIVHRDLKPGNLFRAIRPDGSTIIKVLDFGVSKALSVDIREAGVVTTTDAIFGSPLYMSPEQMQSAARADERSDIWSLGVVLFELLTRRMPFEAESMAGLAVVIATEPPTSVTKYLASTPPGLDEVIARCLEKRVADRYASVADLAADLEPLLPSSRARVERIQRLAGEAVAPPRSVPLLPVSGRSLPLSETLGPLDAAGPARSATKPWLKGLVVGASLALSVAGVAIAFRSGTRELPVVRAAPAATVVQMVSAPPPVPAADIPAVTSAAAPSASASAPASGARPSPVWRPKPAAPAEKAIPGISHDRK